MTKHFEFHKAVEDAIYFGRKNMNDAAEGVIVSKIQQGDFKAATYWLTHNNERYVSERRVKYFQYLEHWTLELLKQEVPSDSQFEKLFGHYFVMEELLGPARAREHMETILNVACRHDAALKDIFYAAYAEWSNDKKDMDTKMAAFDKAFPAGLPDS
jgi:hypothetical protein